MRFLLCTALTLSLLSHPALALNSDRSKPIEIYADDFQGDRVEQIYTYTGNVEMHQGTLVIYGNKLRAVVTKDGYRKITITGNPVRMKEQQEAPKGVSKWSHGKGQTAVYSDLTNTVQFQKNARVHTTENGRVKDAFDGDVVEYNLITEQSRVIGKKDAKGKQTRVKTVLSSGKNSSGVVPAPGTPKAAAQTTAKKPAPRKTPPAAQNAPARSSLMLN